MLTEKEVPTKMMASASSSHRTAVGNLRAERVVRPAFGVRASVPRI
jgi:hypothetical protein